MSDRAESVAVVLLAAGSSSRFGSAKPLADFAGEPLVRRLASAATASKAGRVLVVVDSIGGATARSLSDLDLRIVENPDAEQGQGTSIRRGVEALGGDATAVVFVNADQPFVDAAVLDGLIGTWDGDPDTIVVAAFRGRRGSPALFARGSFEPLRRLEGDEGGRRVIADSSRVAEFEVESEKVLLDADTPAELERLKALI